MLVNSLSDSLGKAHGVVEKWCIHGAAASNEEHAVSKMENANINNTFCYTLTVYVCPAALMALSLVPLHFWYRRRALHGSTWVR